MDAMSPQIGQLAAALAKAQGQMSSAKKDAVNPHLRNKYADLSAVWDACRGPLSSNGLSVVQAVQSADDSCVSLASFLLHESGEWISSQLTIPVKGNAGINPAQALGSALSYGRRYSLAALIGITQDDDDAATAGPPPQGRTGSPPPASDKQRSMIQTKCRKNKWALDQTLQRILLTDIKLEALTAPQASQVIEALLKAENGKA